MGLPLRRSLIGYRRRSTEALFAELEEEQRITRVERENRLTELAQEIVKVREEFREREHLVQEEQEEQRVLMALLEELSARGMQMLEAAKASFAKREAKLQEELARREAVLGQRRQALHALRDTTASVVRKALEAMEDLPEAEAPAPQAIAEAPTTEGDVQPNAEHRTRAGA